MNLKHTTNPSSHSAQEFSPCVTSQPKRATPESRWCGRKGEPRSRHRSAVPGGWARKEEGVFGHNAWLSRARRREPLRGLPGASVTTQGGKMEQTKLNCVSLPTLAQHSWNWTARGRKGRLGGIWTPDPWSPLQVLLARNRGPFHPAPNTPFPSGQKNNSQTEARNCCRALRNLTPTRAAAGGSARRARGSRPQKGKARRWQLEPGREARWKGGGGLITSPDAQSELGCVQVHHIVPQEPVQHVHDHRLEHHFPQPRWTRSSFSLSLPSSGPSQEALSSSAPGRLLLCRHRCRTRNAAASPRRGQSACSRDSCAAPAPGLGRSDRPGESYRACAAASLTLAPFGHSWALPSPRPRLLPHCLATGRASGAAKHFPTPPHRLFRNTTDRVGRDLVGARRLLPAWKVPRQQKRHNSCGRGGPAILSGTGRVPASSRLSGRRPSVPGRTPLLLQVLRYSRAPALLSEFDQPECLDALQVLERFPGCKSREGRVDSGL